MAIKENMKFLFKGVKIDERTEGYVRKRLNGLDRYIENILKAEVEIDKDKKGKFRVEVMLFTPRDMFRADNTTDSIEGSVDMVVDELQNDDGLAARGSAKNARFTALHQRKEQIDHLDAGVHDLDLGPAPVGPHRIRGL